MAKIVVGTSAVSLPAGGNGRYLIQNLGPGTIYLDVTKSADTADGIQIPVNALYETSTSVGNEKVYSLISSAPSTDVRYMIIGDN